MENELASHMFDVKPRPHRTERAQAHLDVGDLVGPQVEWLKPDTRLLRREGLSRRDRWSLGMEEAAACEGPDETTGGGACDKMPPPDISVSIGHMHAA
ncbi:hypothetical protein GCM10023157_37890 [Gluconacetobacter asukensis]